jgi:hypothetical protein
LRLLPRDTSTSVLTAVFDYHAFPADTPGMTEHPRTLPHDRVRHVESALVNVIDDHRFPNPVLPHEIAFRRIMFRIMPPRHCGISYGYAHVGTCDSHLAGRV